jgi:hypothetical protein
MPLNVTLSRDPEKVELGTFHELRLSESELRSPDREHPVARHIQHRWHLESHGESFARIDIAGPLKLRIASGETAGPYLHFHLINGVAYVDNRIFGFFDLQARDWYVVDLGTHSETITMVAHSAEG